MRYVAVRAEHADDEAFGPLGKQVAADPAITPGPVHQLERVGDGTAIALIEVRSGLGRYSEIMADSPQVIEFTVTGDDRGFAYVHLRLEGLTRQLLELHHESELMLELPLEVDADGTLRVTLVGNEGAFADVFDGIPPEVDVEVLETGPYDPDAHRLFDRLTPRQRDVLDAAVREGYYRDPRQATHADLAERLDISPATVGEHLRKIESKIFSQFVADGG